MIFLGGTSGFHYGQVVLQIHLSVGQVDFLTKFDPCLHILEMCLWKLKSLSKINPRLRTLSDRDISLSSNLTGKWLESLCLCCFVPIIINSVLLEFSLSLLDFIHSEMSVRQSLRLDIDLCVSDCDSSMYGVGRV